MKKRMQKYTAVFLALSLISIPVMTSGPLFVKAENTFMDSDESLPLAMWST